VYRSRRQSIVFAADKSTIDYASRYYLFVFDANAVFRSSIPVYIRSVSRREADCLEVRRDGKERREKLRAREFPPQKNNKQTEERKNSRNGE